PAGSRSHTEEDRFPQPPLIINTGTFSDKFGTPHRWHVSRTHTLYWDGEPFIPVGGMLIPDDNFDSFKAQIDLLARNNVRDIYFNVGNSIHMPHTWETKSDEKLRYFQKCIDYMDEAGMRYGMEFSGLQAHGYAYDLMGGKEIAFAVRPNDKGEPEPRMERRNDDEWLEDGAIHAAYRKIRDAWYIIVDDASGTVVGHGKAKVLHDERKDREGKERGAEEQVARAHVPEQLKPGEYRLCLTVSQYRDGWNTNMYYWGEDTPKYYQAIRDLYGRMRMGPGFRFVVDAFWNENNFNHGLVPSDVSFRERHAKYLKSRYGAIERLRKAWAVDGADDTLTDFDDAADYLPLRGVRETTTDVAWDYLINVRTRDLVRVQQSVSQHRYDLLESIGKQVRDYHIEVADLIQDLFDVPVVFKFFSGVDLWHVNDAGLAGGHDGVGMETYGVGEPQLTFMGISALSSCRQSTKTMWLIASEIGEGNHQDQALARNKLFGCTSRLGTMYPIYASLMSGGAKGLYHYYMVPSPGADRFWDDAIIRDPRQLEWMGTFARIVENAPKLADYEPTVYYRFPALYQPNSGLLYSDPHRDYFNTDCLWWVDPAGKLPNGAWLLPTFSLRVPTDMMFINLENAPATLRWADEIAAYLKSVRDRHPHVWDRHPAGPRVTWLGYRRDLGTIPAIDRYYTPEFAKDDDGIEIQVLKPTPDCRVIAANKAGQVWNLMVGDVQIISKNAENKTGWRPDRVVLDGKTHRYDYWTFMRERLGVERLETIGTFDGFSYVDNGQSVTVIALDAELEKTVRIGDHLPAWTIDGTGNVFSPIPPADHPVSFRELPAGTTATYACGDPISIPPDGELIVNLRPDELTLTNSQGRFPWAREGLLFDTTRSHAAVIVRTPGKGGPAKSADVFDHSPPDPTIRIEAEHPTASNFNLDTFSGLAGMSGDGMLGLATRVPPPGPDGYFATWSFDVTRTGTYTLQIREGYLATASPGRWRIDDGLWHAAPNTYVPEDIGLVAQYNALDDERMIFGRYIYGRVELTAGTHWLTYSVVDKRPGGLDIGLQNATPYAKLLDCFRFTPVTEARSRKRLSVRVNLLANPSLEQDTGGWSACEWTGDRWKWVELRDERGWERDFWWTRKVGGEGRIFIDKLMDIGGLTVRQSYVGVRSLRIRAGEQPRRFSGQPIAVAPGERIAFGGYVRAETRDAKADVRVRFLDADGRDLTTVASPPLQGDTHWERM
ncbi:MAG: hypothetical protein HY718_21180, partial [Planctomycetes bacterium]|nr:hypothetical protein [Planctomycetota bacterium]